MARDGYSYLHLPIVAGVVLVALGLKTTLAHVDEPLDAVAPTALLGGVVLYLLGVVALAWRTLQRLSVPRLVGAAVLTAGRRWPARSTPSRRSASRSSCLGF